jgi:hypothetical protein
LSEALTSVEAPAGDFDPRGEWDHRYTVHTIIYAINGQSVNLPKQGWFNIRRGPLRGDTVEIACSLASHHSFDWVNSLEATITCDDDALATPRKWELTSKTLDKERNIVPDTEHARTGALRKGRIIATSGKRRSTRAAEALSSNWTIFDAVQRLPFGPTDPLSFDMLEELDLLKTGQQLTYWGDVEVELSGKPTRLHGFEQMGRGILPYAYWLDEQHRLLIACGGQRAFVWNPTAGLPQG